ncbi:MAG: hypothetical protein LQ342_001323 [Letrouitia transgressa]|nr:MAG: hypothetical protein LQ342_001323 [Letrouitia transgressa]
MATHTPLDPLSVEQIVQKAKNFDYNPLIPLKHAELVLGNLSSHPDARQLENRFNLQQATRDVQSNLGKLEALKPRINKRYERYDDLVRNKNAVKSNDHSHGACSQGKESLKYQPHHARLLSDPALANGTETLAAGENRDLAVELARREIHRRATARKATRQAGISEEEEHTRRTAGLWGNWEEALTKNGQGIDKDTLSKQMQNIRLQVNDSQRDKSLHSSSRPSFESQRSDFHYPTVPEHSTYEDLRTSDTHSGLSESLQPDESKQFVEPPNRPPKTIETSNGADQLPPRPVKEEVPHKSSTTDPTESNPPPHSDLKPSTFTFQPSAYLENGRPLRTIFLPPDLRHHFLGLALPNTRANLETCGILCGTLISNALFISKLVIPDQESTSDTCEMVNESDLFDYVDGEDLMVLGWIHTHPTQTCFMSSRDLHTHCGYQVMMPESIAIVCAPSKGE